MGNSSGYRNPKTPVYSSQENYLENLNGSSYGNNVFLHFIRVLGTLPDEVVGVEATGIKVDKLQQSTKIRWEIRYDPYVNPVCNITSITPSAIQLLGTQVTDVTLNYNFNKAIQTQTLYIDDVETAFTPTDLGNNQYRADLSGLALSDDTIFKIKGNDGTNDCEDTIKLRFGDYFYHGKTTADWTSVPGNFVSTFIPDASTDKVIVDENSAISFTCKSGTAEKDFIAIPKDVINNQNPSFKDRDNLLPGGFNEIGTVNIPNGSANDPNSLYTVYISINWNIGGSIYDIT